MRVGSDKYGAPGTRISRHGSGESFRGGTRSPGLPSPNTLLLRSLSSSSAISRVSSHFSYFNSNVNQEEVHLPKKFPRRGGGAETEEATLAFGGGGRVVDKRDSKQDSSNVALDANVGRAKFSSVGGTTTAADNASRAAKSKTQWGWTAGKSIFGKKAIADEKKAGGSEASVMASTAAAAAAAAATVTTAAANAVTAVSAGTASATMTTFGDRDKSRGGGTGGGPSGRSRDVGATDPSQKTVETTRRPGVRRLGGETAGISREPGGERERDRGVRSAVEQRFGADRNGGARDATDARSRDRRPRQTRSGESPLRVATSAGGGALASGAAITTATTVSTTSTGLSSADAAAEAAHGVFSVPAASYADARDGGGAKQQRHSGNKDRSVSTEVEDAARRDRREHDRDHRANSDEKKTTRGGGGGVSSHYRSEDGRERERGDTRSDTKRRPTPIQVGTRKERDSTQRPSRSDRTRTRTRSEERIPSSGKAREEGQQWSDLANPRPRPFPSPTPEAVSAAGLFNRVGTTGKAGMFNQSPANSSNIASDDKGRTRRVRGDETSTVSGFGSSSLAGWGETVAAEAEAEVLGRSHYVGRGKVLGGQGGGTGGGRSSDKTEDTGDTTLRGQPERTRLHQMVAALTDLCLYLFGVSPLTLEDCPSMLEHLPNEDDDWDEVNACFVLLEKGDGCCGISSCGGVSAVMLRLS